jgi:hypothetical protein
MAQDVDHHYLPPEISSIVKSTPEDGVGIFVSSLKGDVVFGRTHTGIRRRK